MSLEKLAELSRAYGSNAEFVLAGGGNTSWKDGNSLYIKASGYSLGDITPIGFAKMDKGKLDAIWQKKYPEDKDIRETEALKDLMAARAISETKRPSVETLLHALFPQAYVVHMHPALVNGLTCARDGEKLTAELFGPGSGIQGKPVWIPTVNPGYILAKTIKDRTDAHTARGNGFPSVLFLQNHGVFVGADFPEEIEKAYSLIFDILGKRVKRQPDISDLGVRTSDFERRVARFEAMLKEEMKAAFCGFLVNGELLKYCAAPETMAPLLSAYTPDHIVYAGHSPLYVHVWEEEAGQRSALHEALKDYRAAWGITPKTVVLQNTGVFSCQGLRKAADAAVHVFGDAVKVAVYAESFGGRQFMPQDQIEFILTWEVEQYRAKISTE